jgi:hypothetical protein
VVASVHDLDGWLTDGQAHRLYRAARDVAEQGTIVEIGSFRGKSTIVLATAAPAAATVVAIDPHAGNDRGPQEIEGFAEAASEDFVVFHENLARAGLDDRVRHVRERSLDALAAVAGPVDLLYVDGAHRFGPASADLRLWGDRVAPGGTLLVHDAFSSVGVTLALLRSVVFGRSFRYLGRTGSLVEYRRQRLMGRARWANAAVQLRELPWFARNVVIKVLLLARRPDLARRLGHTSGGWPY